MRISTPKNQRRFTNVGKVFLKMGGRRYEIGVYKNMVKAFRAGYLKKAEKVLQVAIVFRNLRTGERASDEDLQKTFGTTDQLTVCTKILMDGEMQVNAKEREAWTKFYLRRIANEVADLAVNPKTNYPFSADGVERMMDQFGYSYRPTVQTKAQALHVIRFLRDRGIRIGRVKSHVHFKVPQEHQHAVEEFLELHKPEVDASRRVLGAFTLRRAKGLLPDLIRSIVCWLPLQYTEQWFEHADPANDLPLSVGDLGGEVGYSLLIDRGMVNDLGVLMRQVGGEWRETNYKYQVEELTVKAALKYPNWDPDLVRVLENQQALQAARVAPKPTEEDDNDSEGDVPLPQRIARLHETADLEGIPTKDDAEEEEETTKKKKKNPRRAAKGPRKKNKKNEDEDDMSDESKEVLMSKRDRRVKTQKEPEKAPCSDDEELWNSDGEDKAAYEDFYGNADEEEAE